MRRPHQRVNLRDRRRAHGRSTANMAKPSGSIQ